MAGEELESILASREARESTTPMLLLSLRRDSGQPEKSLKRHRQRRHGADLLRIVLRAASSFRVRFDTQANRKRLKQGYQPIETLFVYPPYLPYPPYPIRNLFFMLQ